MILEKTKPALKGALSRWLVELRTGVFIGHPTPRVRDELWQRVLRDKEPGCVMQLWSTATEQGFAFRTVGQWKRELIDFDGLTLSVRRREPGK